MRNVTGMGFDKDSRLCDVNTRVALIAHRRDCLKRAEITASSRQINTNSARVSTAPALPFLLRQTRLRFRNTLSSIGIQFTTAFGLMLLDFLCRRYHSHYSAIHSTRREFADLEMICPMPFIFRQVYLTRPR